ncbi:MAG: DUF3179 domain-containing (seleno)protein [Halioglobus sp.]
MWQMAYWILMVAGILIALQYFRDLGDLTQIFLNVTRKRMVFAIRNEYKIIAAALACAAVGTLIDIQQNVSWGWSTEVFLGFTFFFAGFPWVFVHIGLRNQQSNAAFYSIEEAKKYVRSDESVIVLENNGEARAHPDYHMKRPHLVGTSEGLGGDRDVILTYCAMTHLGLGYKAEIAGKPQDLTVIAQIGNNLIMRNGEGEPIQQMYGTRECDGRYSDTGMQQWPTYRMPLRAFEKAFPDGEVFLNKIPSFWKNPLLCMFDHVVEWAVIVVVAIHDTQESLLFNTMDVIDDRLKMKEYVWGFNVGKDSVAFTEEFIHQNGDIINTTVGDRDIVVAYDPDYESVGIYYNDSGTPVTRIDFWGESDQGKLTRVNTVKAASYWCVWVNYFPETDLNRAANEMAVAA